MSNHPQHRQHPQHAQHAMADTTLMGRAVTSTGTDVLVRVRYFAGARAAAGVAEQDVRLAGASGETTVARVLDTIVGQRGPALARVLTGCSFLLDGLAVHDRATTVASGAELDVLPPFAGG